MPQVMIILLALCLSMFMNTVYAKGEVGSVVYSNDQAWVIRGDVRQTAEKGALMYKDDLLITGSRGRMKLLMQDGSKVYVGANSRLSLAKYAMDGNRLLDASFDMFWGKARFFVNKINEKKASFKVHTTTAVLGVRGTEFLVLVPPTPALLRRAFDVIDHASLPSLPTRMVLVHGIVEVGTKQGFLQQVTAGNTADVDVAGQATVRQTRESDADQQPVLEDGGVSGTETGGEPEIMPEQPPVTPPSLDESNQEPFAAPPVSQGEDDVIKNAKQNLGSTTDVRITPTFVVP